jgi:hypothetical protein
MCFIFLSARGERMPFTIEEFHDLIRMLDERPEWRSELRRLVLTDELLALPAQTAELRVHTEQRFQELAVAQRRTEEQVAAVSAQLADLIQVVQTFSTDIGELKGRSLEGDYRTRVYAYFSRVVRRAHALSPDELTSLLEDAIDRGALSEDQAEDVSLADVIIQGRRRSDGAEVFLVVEVSWGVGPQDVERATRRAALLAHTGSPALPVVAGKWVTPEAAQLARTQQVWQLTNGRAIRPE